MPVDHPVYKTLEEAYKKAVDLHGDKGMIPVVEENGIYNSYLEMADPESADEQVAELETQASASRLMQSKPKAKAARTNEERNTVWALEDEIGDQPEIQRSWWRPDLLTQVGYRRSQASVRERSTSRAAMRSTGVGARCASKQRPSSRST